MCYHMKAFLIMPALALQPEDQIKIVNIAGVSILISLHKDDFVPEINDEQLITLKVIGGVCAIKSIGMVMYCIPYPHKPDLKF